MSKVQRGRKSTPIGASRVVETTRSCGTNCSGQMVNRMFMVTTNNQANVLGNSAMKSVRIGSMIVCRSRVFRPFYGSLHPNDSKVLVLADLRKAAQLTGQPERAEVL